MRRRPLALVLGAIAAIILAAGTWLALIERGPTARDAAGGAGAGRPLLLFTSLPIYWNEAADIGTLLSDKAQRHWARAAIEERRPLRPVDTLEAAQLAGSPDLLAVQPRPLSPQENVALDRWVEQGGRLLLVVDPALTAESAFAIGDRRRPEAIAMLSPILARWGLELTVDEDQPFGERAVDLGAGLALPVNLPGKLVARAGGRGDARCRLEREGLLAECAIGRGRALVIADATLFESAAGATDLASREAVLAALLDRVFAR